MPTMPAVSPRRFRARGALMMALALGVACSGAVTDDAGDTSTATDTPAAPTFECDPDNGGIELADGFCAVVFADDLGVARHLAVDGDGDVYVQRQPVRRRGEETDDGNAGGLVALRDSDGDGRADAVEEFGDLAGTGAAIHDGHLYYSSQTEVWRVALDPEALVPTAEPELIATGFPSQGSHASKPMAFDEAGHMYVTVGGPSNACQQEGRTPGSPGQDPCPQLQWQGGIWQFDAARPGQTQEADGTRYATGIRNALALDWKPGEGLYALQHGRDQLSYLWPDLFTDEQSAELPAEEFLDVDEDDDFGWPYCYYDHLRGAKVLAPEYGGDGTEQGRCADVEEPIVAFPGHWAPNDLVFYRGDQFPERYRGGAFIAFHGSWNRAPLEQEGYRVVFVPFEAGTPTGEWSDFATGFPGVETVGTPGDARHRPTGLAVGPDGSLYVSDSRQGRIWRVIHRGG